MESHLRDPRTGLILISAPAVTDSEARQIRRQNRTGETVLMRRGVYASTTDYAELSPRARHLAMVNAVVETRRIRPIISHLSAALFWGMPLRPAMPTTVHLVVPPQSFARSKNGVTVHHETLRDGDVVEVDGLLVTTPERTLLDLSRTSPFITSVSALDFAIHPRRPVSFLPLSRDQLLDRVHALGSVRGHRRALRAVEFSRIGADNAGETHSRIVIAELGFPSPEIQVRHVNPRGGYYFVDFEWPEFSLIGEFDGRGKYLKPENGGRLTPSDAVIEEKIREDHLRAEGNRVSRWGPREVNDSRELQRILVQAGLPCSR